MQIPHSEKCGNYEGVLYCGRLAVHGQASAAIKSDFESDLEIDVRVIAYRPLDHLPIRPPSWSPV